MFIPGHLILVTIAFWKVYSSVYGHRSVCHTHCVGGHIARGCALCTAIVNCWRRIIAPVVLCEHFTLIFCRSICGVCECASLTVPLRKKPRQAQKIKRIVYWNKSTLSLQQNQFAFNNNIQRKLNELKSSARWEENENSCENSNQLSSMHSSTEGYIIHTAPSFVIFVRLLESYCISISFQ